MLDEPVNAVPPGPVPDSPFTVGPRVELPPPPPTDEVDDVEELPLELDDDVGGGVVDDEVGLGQLVRSVAASSEK